jgi:hypothetical protein
MPVGPFQLVAVAAAILYPTSFSSNTLAIVVSRAIVVAVLLLLPVEQGIVKIPISHVVAGESRFQAVSRRNSFL